MKPIIQVRNVSKQYKIGTRKAAYGTLRDSITNIFRRAVTLHKKNSNEEAIWALRDINFDILPGEVVGVIGRNGAGKSTLLKILSRITEPTTGEIDIYGRIGSLLEVGTGFHQELSGRENIYLSGAVNGMKHREITRKFDEIIDFAEIDKFIDTPVKHYSSGMYMRLAFAVAAHLEPEILIVDEVIAVGDAAFQKKCLGKMGDIAHEGRTVIFVSHSLPAIRSLCTKGFYLDMGELVREGDINECISQYLRLEVGLQSNKIDTQSLSRPQIGVDESGVLRITQVELGSLTQNSMIRTGEPLRLKISYRSERNLKDVILGFTIHTTDGALLFECRSNDSVETMRNLPPGDYCIEAQIDSNQLLPGYYILSVGARCANKPLDWLPNLLTFQVDNKERYESIWLEAPGGVFRVVSTWSSVNSQHSVHKV